MGTKVNSNYEDLLTFTRASKGHALRPVSYGDELVTNGDFSTDSDWTKTAGATIANGVVSLNAIGDFVSQSNICEAGKIYAFTCNINQGSITVKLGTGAYVSTDGQLLISLADGTEDRVIIRAASSNTVIDNVSVKEVLFDQPDGTLTLFEHPTNIPRVEYDADGNRLGLLVEEARTNLFPYSNFSADWTATGGASLSQNSGLSPDGLQNAVALNATSTDCRIFDALALNGSAHSFSVYAKAGINQYLMLRLGASSGQYRRYFDLENGVLAGETGGPQSSSIEDAGNGWYRCSITTSDTSTTSQNVLMASTDTDLTEAGSNTGGVGTYLFGAQLETGSFPTSYIKNEGTASGKDRSADIASIPVADFGYNQSAGTVTVEVDSLMTTLVGNPMAYNFNNGTSQERLTVFASQGTWRFVATDGNTQQSSLLVGTFGEAKIASSFEQNKFNHCVNATLGTEDTSGTMPTITELGIGSQLGGNQLNGHIKSIQYYPRRLSNAQLVELTS